MGDWTYKGKIFTDPGEYYGFVYIITNLTNQRSYIGRKYFTYASSKQVNKKRKKIRKASDWQDYFGSNKTLQTEVKKLGKKNFNREIIRLCKTRGECAYYETKEIFDRNALMGDDYYNEWLSIRITKNHVKAFSPKDFLGVYKKKQRK